MNFIFCWLLNGSFVVFLMVVMLWSLIILIDLWSETSKLLELAMVIAFSAAEIKEINLSGGYVHMSFNSSSFFISTE